MVVVFLVEERKLPVASVLSITPLAAAIEMGTGPCVHRMKHVHVRGRAPLVVMSLGLAHSYNSPTWRLVGREVLCFVCRCAWVWCGFMLAFSFSC